MKPSPDFSAYIAERTRDFIGREWVFAEIDAWLAGSDAPRCRQRAGHRQGCHRQQANHSRTMVKPR
jgi:hypothetical protein